MDVGKIALTIVLIVASALIYVNFTTSRQGCIIYLATTTSVRDTGLLDLVVPLFEEHMVKLGYSVDVRYSAVGSGQAIEMGRRGDADIVIVHAPDLERGFMDEGYGICRRIFAYNFYVVVGPRNDPLNISDTSTIQEAFRRIFNAGIEGKARFISRGDKSGTNMKELQLWGLAGVDPGKYSGGWYIESGKGMGDTLIMAENLNGYTLTDIGTWLRFKDKLQHLRVLVKASKELLNVYSVIVTRHARNLDIAMEFVEFLCGEGQEILKNYGVEEYGQPLFHPIKLADSSIWLWIREMNIDFSPNC